MGKKQMAGWAILATPFAAEFVASIVYLGWLKTGCIIAGLAALFGIIWLGTSLTRAA